MILPPYFSGETIILELHGWIALIALMVVILQVSLSITIKERAKLRSIHLYLGYGLFVILALQVILGLILVSFE